MSNVSLGELSTIQ